MTGEQTPLEFLDSVLKTAEKIPVVNLPTAVIDEFFNKPGSIVDDGWNAVKGVTNKGVYFVVSSVDDIVREANPPNILKNIIDAIDGAVSSVPSSGTSKVSNCIEQVNRMSLDESTKARLRAAC